MLPLPDSCRDQPTSTLREITLIFQRIEILIQAGSLQPLLRVSKAECDQFPFNISTSGAIEREVFLSCFCKWLKRELGTTLGVPWQFVAARLSHSGCLSLIWHRESFSLAHLEFMGLTQQWKVWLVAADVVRSRVRLRAGWRREEEVLQSSNTHNRTHIHGKMDGQYRGPTNKWGEIKCSDTLGQTLKCGTFWLLGNSGVGGRQEVKRDVLRWSTGDRKRVFCGENHGGNSA